MKDIKNGKRTKEIAKKFLLFLAGGAILTLAMIAPGAVFAAKPLLFLKDLDQRRLRATVKRMRKQRILDVKEKEDGQMIIKITKKGEKLALRYKLSDLQILKPKKWDRIWRIVIFDVPRYKNSAREALRQKLRELGFYKLQNSVFVYPHECEKEIEFIKAVFDIQREVSFIRAIGIDNEDFLKIHFGLIKI